MATQVKKIKTLTVKLEPRCGSLSKIFGAFKESGINITASWGYEMGPGEAKASFYCTDLDKTSKVLTQLGLKPETGNAYWAEGEDKVGEYCELLQRVSKAGINLGSTDAFGMNGRFATVLYTEESQIPALGKALGV